MMRSPRSGVAAGRLAALGLVSVAIIGIASVVAAIPYRGSAGEGYSPLDHYISELGEVGQSQLAAWFDIALIVGGAGLAAFAILLGGRMSGRLRYLFLLFAVVSGISGTLVGVFPMNDLRVHRVVAGLFFETGWLMVLVFCIWLARGGSGFGRWLLIPGAVAVVASLGFILVYAGADGGSAFAAPTVRPAISAITVMEWAALITLLAWFVAVAIDVGRRRDPATQ